MPLSKIKTNSIATSNVTTSHILDGTILAADLAAGVANTNIGYTPANSAGQNFTGAISALAFQSNYPVVGTVSPASPYTSSIPYGLSIFNLGGLTTDNTFRTFFSAFLDFAGFIFICLGDQPVKDCAIFQASMPSPAYGVYQLTTVSYTDNGWPSGTFGIQYTTNGNNWNLQLKHNSYYASNLTATGYIAFLRLN